MQEEIKSEEKAKKTGGMVFYPREYHVKAEISESYAIGVNSENEKIAVFIIPTESSMASANNKDTAQTIPTFSEFSDTRRKANNPCHCSPENSQENPEGVMVLEQIKKDEEKSGKEEFNGLPVYVCTWASVLREDSEMPKSPVGPGYLEIGFNYRVSPEVNEMMFQYEDLVRKINGGQIENLMDAEEERAALYKKIICGRKKFFVAVMLRNKEIFSLDELSVTNLRNKIKPIIEKYTMKGFYGGVILRVRKGNTVISELSSSCDMVFDYKLKKPKEANVVLDEYIKYNGNKILREANINGYTIDVIPTIRLNFGPMGTTNMSNEFKENGTPKCIKTYVDYKHHQDPMANYKQEKGFLFCDVAVRLAVIRDGKEGAGNLLVSNIHAFSSPKGNVLTIGVSGNSEYEMNY